MTYTWNGAYGQAGTSGPNGRSGKVHGNKGVMRQRREVKRAQAESRNALTLPENRRSHAREYGFSRNSDLRERSS